MKYCKSKYCKDGIIIKNSHYGMACPDCERIKKPLKKSKSKKIPKEHIYAVVSVPETLSYESPKTHSYWSTKTLALDSLYQWVSNKKIDFEFFAEGNSYKYILIEQIELNDHGLNVSNKEEIWFEIIDSQNIKRIEKPTEFKNIVAFAR
jgi:hypothetical protein